MGLGQAGGRSRSRLGEVRGRPVASSEAHIDPVKAQATLDIEIESGPVFRVGAIEVRGTNRYDPKIVERLNPLRPGDEYSEEK